MAKRSQKGGDKMGRKKKVGKIKRKKGMFYYIDGEGNIYEMEPKRRKRR